MTVTPADLGAVQLADIIRYSGASGDRNPLHYDPAFARESGFDGVLSMGMLHGGWLLSQLLADLADYDRPGPAQIRIRYQGVVYPGAALRATSSRSDDAITGELTVAGAPAASASIESGGPSPTPRQPESDVQTDEFQVELGAAREFGAAVRWPHPIMDGAPVPPTFLTALSFWHTNPDPIARVGFDGHRTLLGETAADLVDGPLRVGERFTVREFVANRRTKSGRSSVLEFADAVSELSDESGLRASYRNTLILRHPPEPEPARLVGSQDPLTGQIFYPTRALAVDGSFRACEPIDLSEAGILYSWTSYDGTDYGQVDLPEGVRIQTRLAPGEHRIGAAYRLVGAAEEWCFDRA